jgi:hypothetical protein
LPPSGLFAAFFAQTTGLPVLMFLWLVFKVFLFGFLDCVVWLEVFLSIMLGSLGRVGMFYVFLVTVVCLIRVEDFILSIREFIDG